jgi:hypothetical protein
MSDRDKSDLNTIPAGRNGCPTTDEARRDAREIDAPLPLNFEDAIVAILSIEPRPNETHLISAARRELSLRDLFGHLSVLQARALARRLDADRDDDRLATAFRRFTHDRKQRLRAYLADTPRRAALSRNR